MKKFKAKKTKKKKRYIKYVFIFFFFFSYVFMFLYFKNNSNKINKNILTNNFNYFKRNYIDAIDKKIDYIIKTPTKFLNANIKNVHENKKIEKVEKKVDKINNTNKVEIIEKKEFNPIVYIYNTHNLEEYDNYNVFEAAFLLKEKLNKSGIDTLLEEESVSVFLQTNGLKYYEAYNVSRNYLVSAREKYNNLTYFFDIHRDTVNKEKSTITYNDKNYAKVLFLVGLENSNYEENLKNTNVLNEIISNKIPGISRGIMKKEGKNVNGIYNQDLSSNLFLIEVGSLYNTKEEVENTIDVISSMITEYIKGAL